GKDYQLACNNGPNHLHGGDKGYNNRIWKASPYSEGSRTGVVFSLVSPDGEEHYPGKLRITADYSLDEQGRLFMDFKGETDKTTIINITNHAYWNLAGAASGTIFNHLVKIYANRYLPVDDTSIPTDGISDVEGTAFDFQKEKPISEEFDHCMVINGKNGELRIAVEVRDPGTGRKITLYTNRPGVQFYTGNYLEGNPHPRNGGFCLEPQDFPDAPNRPGFPSVVIHPGETYHHRSMIEFSIQS
ncbi:MAG: galactose mutarotase, partial [Spirochaetaceae bacterium]|nr:galactose mutarotase [Spirochaetaceae bacterium]